MKINGRYSSGWRDYQKVLQGKTRKKYLFERLPLLALYSGCTFLVLAVVFCAGSWISGYLSRAGHRPSDTVERPGEFPQKLSRQDLSVLLRDLKLDLGNSADHLALEIGGERVTIKTSLDTNLQDYIIGLLKRSKTLQAAVVVLCPNDGRILAMASYKSSGNSDNLCLKADFPAASIFKIVSAAAALESAGFTPDRPVFFRGRKHTLYKSQLKEARGRDTSKTSFRNAFASSINSVFGKLGIYDLGQDVMYEYANRFLFNRAIQFDLPVEVSSIHVPDDDFGLAEIASGFNKRTLISPLHAALLVSTVANNGIVMEPWFIGRITGESGEVLYQRRPTMLALPISRKTAEGLKLLMSDTVLYGTSRKSFQALRRKKAFRDVELGAKTGTINDTTDQFKYDWLTAYAFSRNRANAICIAVLGVHGEKLGIRANELGRYIINYHFTS